MIPEPDPFSLGIQFDLHKDLSFIPALVKEGDIQNAVTVSLVMWEFLKEDASRNRDLVVGSGNNVSNSDEGGSGEF